MGYESIAEHCGVRHCSAVSYVPDVDRSDWMGGDQPRQSALFGVLPRFIEYFGRLLSGTNMCDKRFHR